MATVAAILITALRTSRALSTGAGPHFTTQSDERDVTYDTSPDLSSQRIPEADDALIELDLYPSGFEDNPLSATKHSNSTHSTLVYDLTHPLSPDYPLYAFDCSKGPGLPGKFTATCFKERFTLQGVCERIHVTAGQAKCVPELADGCPLMVHAWLQRQPQILSRKDFTRVLHALSVRLHQQSTLAAIHEKLEQCYNADNALCRLPPHATPPSNASATSAIQNVFVQTAKRAATEVQTCAVTSNYGVVAAQGTDNALDAYRESEVSGNANYTSEYVAPSNSCLQSCRKECLPASFYCGYAALEFCTEFWYLEKQAITEAILNAQPRDALFGFYAGKDGHDTRITSAVDMMELPVMNVCTDILGELCIRTGADCMACREQTPECLLDDGSGADAGICCAPKESAGACEDGYCCCEPDHAPFGPDCQCRPTPF